MKVIQLEDVARIYRVGEVETPALRGVTLDIDQGEFSAIVGPSGSGKTTMLQLMGCLDKPTGGSVRIDGHDVTRLNANKRADLRKAMIGFVASWPIGAASTAGSSVATIHSSRKSISLKIAGIPMRLLGNQWKWEMP